MIRYCAHRLMSVVKTETPDRQSKCTLVVAVCCLGHKVQLAHEIQLIDWSIDVHWCWWCVCSDTEKSQVAPTTVNNDTTSSLVSDTRQLPQVCPSVCLVMVCSLSVACCYSFTCDWNTYTTCGQWASDDVFASWTWHRRRLTFWLAFSSRHGFHTTKVVHSFFLFLLCLCSTSQLHVTAANRTLLQTHHQSNGRYLEGGGGQTNPAQPNRKGRIQVALVFHTLTPGSTHSTSPSCDYS